MKIRCLVLVSFLLLVACEAVANYEPGMIARAGSRTPAELPIATPSVTPQPTRATPTPDFGTVAGSLCYPSSETPPMTLFFENIDGGETVSLNIDRGQASYKTQLPPGEYTAYALTVGMNLRGAYSCEVNDPCAFRVEPGQVASIDLCTWYSPPGNRPPAAADQPGQEAQGAPTHEGDQIEMTHA